MQTHKILCLDNDELLLEVLALVLERAGFQPLKAATPTEAIALARREPPALILLDLKAGAALPALLEATPGTPIILMSTTEIDERALAALEAGAAGFIFKPALNGRKLEQIIADYLPQPEIMQ